MNIYKKLSTIIIALLFISCGEAVVNVDQKDYEPKIVIDGYIYPHKKIENIRLSRNFPLNTKINISDFPLSQAEVSLTDLESDKTIELTYNPFKISFEYNGSDFNIDYEKSYRLDITAEIEGQTLSASSTTTTPVEGFKINLEGSHLDSMKYRETDTQGNVKTFDIQFLQSESTDFYVLSIIALDAHESTFVEDNPYGLEKDDLDDELMDLLKYESRWVQTSAEGQAAANIEIPWLDTWFYGDYRAILYAGDENFEMYYITHDAVQDIDGNLYEPKFNISGDGIGVFGSAITDTVYFKILK